MKLIGEYTENDFKELKLILYAGAKNYLGISNLPDQYDLKKICEFLKSYFKDLTANEIDKALSMYANGKIVVYTQSYGVLSLKFLSEVLHEYRLQRKSWRDFEKMKSNEQKMLNAPVEDYELKCKNLYNWIVNYVKENNNIPDLYAWNEVYHYCEKEKIIELSKEDKTDFFNLMKEEIQDEIKLNQNNPDKREELKTLLKISENNISIAQLCRKKLVILHLNNLLQTQLN
jgi:hypothetical protein